MRESSHPGQPQCSRTKIEGNRPTQLRRTCHSLPSPFSTRLIWQPHLPGLHFLAQHVEGHGTAQCHLCKLPNPAGKEGSCHLSQPDDVQSIIAHIAHVQGEERTLLENISGREGRTEVGIEEGTKDLTDLLRCWLLLYQEEEDFAVRPILP